MAAGPTIAAQTAQPPGVAGASASSGAGLFGKSTAAHGTMAGFESLLAAFFGNQAATPAGVIAGALTAVAGKATAQATGDGAAKSADDKKPAADATATTDAAAATSTDATSTALLYLLAGQTPVAPTPSTSTGVAKTTDGAVTADNGLKSGAGQAGLAKGAALAQAARLAQAATDTDTAPDANAAEAADETDATGAKLTLPGKLGQGLPAARAAGAAAQDANAYAPAAQAAATGAKSTSPIPANATATPAANAAPAPPATAEVAPPTTLPTDIAAPPAAEVQAAAAEIAPPPAPLAAERPVARNTKVADVRKSAGPVSSAPALTTATPLVAAAATTPAGAAVAPDAGGETLETIDPAAARDTAKLEADAKEAAAQPAATAPQAADQATGTSKAITPVRGSPETVASLAAQIVKKLDGRTTRFDVALSPGDLGRVDVRIEIGAHGRLTASMSFENPQAAAELRGRAGELQSALEQAGFDMSGGMSFDVAGDPNQSQANQNQTGQSTSDGGGQARGRAFQAALDTASGSADAALSSALAYRARPAAGVDIRI